MSNDLNNINVTVKQPPKTQKNVNPFLSTAITTPTRFGKVRGKSILILLELSSEKRTVEIGEAINYPAHYVWIYLKNLQKYGLVFCQDSFWRLTDLGRQFVSYLKIKNLTITETRKKAKESESKLKKAKDTTKITEKQVFLNEYFENHSLDDRCRGVVEVLLANYRLTGRQGRIFRDVYSATEWFNQKRLEKGLHKLLNPSELGETLITLHNEGTCWRPDLSPGGHPKIGLSKEFIQKYNQQKNQA